MATNYTIKEAVKIIAEGKDMEQLADIGKRFPVLAHKVAVVAAKAGEDFVSLMSFMPDYLTANKVNTAIKAAIAGTSTESDEDTDDEATEGTNETTGTDYESMSGKDLWALTGKLGIRKSLKSNKKADLIEALKAYDAGKLEDSDEDVDEGEEVTEENAYEGMSAMELFKECKKRGIKAAPKKPAKFYADLLIKNDEEAEAESEDEDGWDEEETEAPKKTDKKPAKPEKTDKKPAKKAKVEEEDEDDDWDI